MINNLNLNYKISDIILMINNLNPITKGLIESWLNQDLPSLHKGQYRGGEELVVGERAVECFVEGEGVAAEYWRSVQGALGLVDTNWAVVGVDEEHVLEAALTAQLGPFPGVHVDLCRSDLWLFLLLTRDVWLLLFF